MKTNLNNIWEKMSLTNLQQNYTEQMSDLFLEHRYFKFQNEFFQHNIGSSLIKSVSEKLINSVMFGSGRRRG